MKTIANDAEFKNALSSLDPARQRLVAARFVKHVLDLGKDPRIERALKVAADENAGEEDLAAALKNARAAVLDSHTRCGAEGDWSEQAGYFVARAAVAAIGGSTKASGPAWAAAMSSRMARTCESIDADADAAGQERQAQYRILAEYLN